MDYPATESLTGALAWHWPYGTQTGLTPLGACNWPEACSPATLSEKKVLLLSEWRSFVMRVKGTFAKVIVITVTLV